MSRIAVVQRPPVFLDRAQTLERAVEAIREAAEAEAQLIVFPETFIPGYPARRTLDVVGHYARPDLFQLRVNTNALKPVTFTEFSEGE